MNLPPKPPNSGRRGGRLGADYPHAAVPPVDSQAASAHQMNYSSESLHQSRLEAVLAKVIGTPKASLVSNFCGSLLTVSSMICVPMIFGASLLMATQRPPIENISLKQNSIPSVVVHAGSEEPFQVTSPIILDAHVMKAKFMAVLLDDKDRKIYSWPVVESDNPGTLLGNSTYRIPSTLLPGDYTLHVQVIYKVNPLVEGQVRTDIARVIVVPPTH